MDDASITSGRGHREKIPSAKLKEQAGAAVSNIDKSKPVDNKIFLPVYIVHRDPKLEAEQEELKKNYDHSKTGPNGEKHDFYTLGHHVETKEKRFYVRARRDPQTLYFHAAEAPPYHARLSDEQHPQCQIDKLRNCFSKDMLSKTGEWGHYTTKANVFAREGQFFWEAKIISQAPPGREPPKASLASFQEADRTSTNRGGLRVGFARREAAYGEPLGNSGYSYAVATRSGFGRSYGVVRFNSDIQHIQDGEDFDDLSPGDVVGLMITLPPLEVHKKVVEGTFNPADYPHLECGPAQPSRNKRQKTSKSGKQSTSGKSKTKEREDSVKPQATTETDPLRAALRAQLQPAAGNAHTIPSDHEIIRDRNPFVLRGQTYFECPDYTPHNDLCRPSAGTKTKTQNPETGKSYDLTTETHPQHELPHLRTLPGSKIEVWVNGKYHGVVARHLFAFLPPASFIEIGNKTSLKEGAVDDGQLGYYPALSHFTGGAVECKFDGPWWCGFERDVGGLDRGGCRPIGERYREQIVEDFVCDVVDEIYLERLNGSEEYMRRSVLSKEGGVV
ncbi:transcription factor, contains a PHD finger motif [Exophiala xenobiotica]|uniref:Transcription factor, contains a PHD finger motif n=1 Tax=Lithohypha guttulata TaxID=1690604 RepID=A0ABR0KBC9_9EURO|nr:transcription factor, contains a PHD finger motif [Lithohypha guttulata]KAK5318931.1 transcription factor, contains a PHD finger motif [Exophiala xenobiotica]